MCLSPACFETGFGFVSAKVSSGHPAPMTRWSKVSFDRGSGRQSVLGTSLSGTFGLQHLGRLSAPREAPRRLPGTGQHLRRHAGTLAQSTLPSRRPATATGFDSHFFFYSSRSIVTKTPRPSTSWKSSTTRPLSGTFLMLRTASV